MISTNKTTLISTKTPSDMNTRQIWIEQKYTSSLIVHCFSVDIDAWEKIILSWYFFPTVIMGI